MPRTLSSGLQTHLQGGLLTVAILVLITRLDGVTLGFTNFDQEIVFDGVTYYPTDGASTSAISQKASPSPDNLTFDGILASGRITDTDLLAGRYQGASVLVQLVNWANLSQAAMIMQRGFLGKITVKDGGYQAEVRGLSQLLKQNTGDLCSPTCRVRRLGDLQCKASLSGSSVGGNDVRTITFVGMITGGDYTLTFNGQTTTSLAYNTSASGLQSQLQALSSIGSGNVSVTGGPANGGSPRQPFVITFQGALANKPQPDITVANTLTGTGIIITVQHTTVGIASGLPLEVTGTVTAVPDILHATFSIPTGSGWTWSAFANGLVTFTSGANNGITREVAAPPNGSGTTVANPLELTLRLPFPFGIAIGDTATLQQGCDRKYTTCSNKFNNSINFHGEPLLPGNDSIFLIGRGA